MDKPKRINVTQVRYREALQKIANGVTDPVEVAREAIREHRAERRRSLVGIRFTRLKVIFYAGMRQRPDGKVLRKRATWLCMCDCGTLCRIEGNTLLAGSTKSCGCLRSDQMQRFYKHGRYAKRLMPPVQIEVLHDSVSRVQKVGDQGQAEILDGPAARRDAA